MIRWLFLFWPPWSVVFPVILAYAGFHACWLSIEWIASEPLFSERDEQVSNGFLGLSGFIVVLYAVYRVSTSHPANRPGYYQWLRNTPWVSQRPLPLGPVHLVWQDLLIPAATVALSCPRLSWQMAPVVVQLFLSSYVLALGLLHAVTGAKGWAYAAGFGIGFMILWALDPVPFFVAAIATYGLTNLGLRASLARFPWENSFVQRNHEERAGRAKSKKDLGWPYDRLGPNAADVFHIDLMDVLLIGVLASWWFFVVSYQLRLLPDASHGRYLVYYSLSTAGVGIRLVCYCYGYSPPLNLLGRVVHFRWVIPGYDQVFVAPLLAAFVGLAAWGVPLWSGVDSLWTTPVAFAVTWWILLGIGPSLRCWRLTGNHRIVPGLENALTVKG